MTVALLVAVLAGCSDGPALAREKVPLQGASVDGLTIRGGAPTCGGRPVGTAVESPTEVRVTVVSEVVKRGDSSTCADGVTIRLSAPLGDRVLVDEYWGEVIQVDRASEGSTG